MNPFSGGGGGSSGIVPPNVPTLGTAWDVGGARGLVYADTRGPWIETTSAGAGCAGQFAAVPVGTGMIGGIVRGVIDGGAWAMGGVSVRDGTTVWANGLATTGQGYTITANFGTGARSAYGMWHPHPFVSQAHYAFVLDGGSWYAEMSADGVRWYRVSAALGFTPTHYGVGVSLDGMVVGVHVPHLIACASKSEYADSIPTASL